MADMFSSLRPPHDNEPSVVKQLSSWVRSHLRPRSDSLKEALEEVLEEHESEGHHALGEEQIMLKNMLAFGDLTVADIMTPRSHITAVDITTSLDDLKAHISHNGHTRIPVYDEVLDHIKGFIHIKDLIPILSSGAPFEIIKLLRSVLFVPPSMKLMPLLLKMRMAGVHMAMVVDEYGGIDGLLTLEDVFEEIVGEIQDEHDDHNDQLHWSPEGTCDVDAKTPIEQVEKELSLLLKKSEDQDDYDTLGGLVFYLIGRVPEVGEVIEHPSTVRFKILAANPRRIERIRIYHATPTMLNEAV